MGAEGPRDDQGHRPVTATMWWVIAGVAVVVVAGLAWAAWTMTLTGQDSTAAGGEASASRPPIGPSPNATPVDGSEVTTPAPHQSDPARLPQLTPPTPLVTAPLPANAAQQGGLVEGFPVPLAEPAAGSDVIDSSISTDGSTMQAALNARTVQSSAAISDHYRVVWGGLGLTPATSEGDAISYADRFTSVTLAFRDTGTGTVYTLYATLRTE